MTNEKVLCRDCEEHYLVTTNELKEGICLSCSRRKRLANSLNRSYIKYKDLTEDEKLKLHNNRNKINKHIVNDTKEKEIDKRSIIYTQEIINNIKSIASEDKSAKDLLNELCLLYPDKNITTGNLNNILKRHNIVYKKGRSKNKTINNNPIIATTIIDHDQGTTQTKYNTNNKDLESTIDSTLDIIVKNALDYAKYLDDDISEENRLDPINEEVTEVLNNKFKKENCYNEMLYNTDDYIKMLEMLLYINEQKNTITRNGAKQHNIMDLYEDDIVHETENILLPKGNTYFQDKLHVLRNKRRALEYNGGDISIMREFLNTIDNNTLRNCITALKTERSKRENFKYIPSVDETMINKYNWCLTPLDKIDSCKSTNVTIIPAVTNTSNRMKSKLSLNTYRVSCKLSGAGYGAFTSYYKDYQAINEDIALSYGKQELEKMKQEKPGILIQDVDIHKIN